MKSKTTAHKALLSSAISMLLCCAMLLGTTMAWFTATVESSGHEIYIGVLDIDLLNGEISLKNNTTTKLFDDVKRWEPNATAVEQLTVVNKGDLAFKYNLTLNCGTLAKSATDQFEVWVYPGAWDTKDNSYEKITADPKWKKVNSLEDTLTEVLAGQSVFSGTMDKDTVVDAAGKKVEAKDTYTVALHMKKDATGKDIMGQKFHINVKLEATQLTSEEDTFGPSYDAAAKYPAITSVYIPAGSADSILTINDANGALLAAVELPDNAPAGTYRLALNGKTEAIDDTGITTAAFDLDMTFDGAPAAAPAGQTFATSVNIGRFLKNVRVNSNLSRAASVPYEYNAFTGILTLTGETVVPFEVEYEPMGENITAEGETLTGGIFWGVNPVTLDPTLDDADSEYIAVNYEQGGETCYIVSERATTTVVAPSAADYTAENGNYTITDGNGKLWNIISGLQNNDHSTVYLLPGTYNEGTTIYVYSSMDIIGLGDKDAVKVVKTSSSSSNRHLFNCNGTKADYIQVTLRNLYLDATAKTTNNKDNAAVQSIRKSMVKCYDLTIVKGSDWDAVAFYVNGNNAVDGVKYPAYLYAENCSLNTTRTFGIVSTSGSYKFFHNGLTYGGTAYTINSGSTLNKAMAPDDWEWD